MYGSMLTTGVGSGTLNPTAPSSMVCTGAAAGLASNAVSPSSNIVRFISPSQRLGETVQDQGARSGGDGPTVGTAARGVNAVSLYGTHTAPIDTRLLGGWGGWGRLEKVWGGRAGGGTTSQTSPNLQNLPNLL